MQRKRPLQMTDRSGLRSGSSFLTPGPEKPLSPGPAPAKQGDSKSPGGGGEHAPFWSCCFSFSDSPWALATKKVRKAGAGLGLVPFCSANPVCGYPFGRGQTGLPRRSPALACGGSRVGALVSGPSAAAAPTFAATTFPPRAADQACRTAVTPGPGAAAALILQGERCWSLSRARRGAGPPETDWAGMRALLPGLADSVCFFPKGRAVGPRQAAYWISQVRAGVWGSVQ